jgi:general nucleoside transport system permease protein
MSADATAARMPRPSPGGRPSGSQGETSGAASAGGLASGLRQAALRIAVVLAGVLVGIFIIALQPGVDAGTWSAVWHGTFGTASGISSVVQLTSPLLLSGVAAAVSARAGMWNIGVEGQLVMGAWAGTAIAFTFPDLPGPWLPALVLIGGVVGGALWVVPPAAARAYLGVNEVVTTLLLNFVATLWLVYWVTGPWADTSFQGAGLGARPITDNAMLSHWTIGDVTIGVSFVIAVVIALATWAVFRYTPFGYRCTLLGADQRTARYAGVDVARTRFYSLVLSGGIGGLVGVIVMIDHVQRFTIALSTYTGYLGLLVAALASASLLGCIPAAVLVALLSAAAGALRIAGIPAEVTLMLTGLMLIAAAITDVGSGNQVGRSIRRGVARVTTAVSREGRGGDAA